MKEVAPTRPSDIEVYGFLLLANHLSRKQSVYAMQVTGALSNPISGPIGRWM